MNIAACSGVLWFTSTWRTSNPALDEAVGGLPVALPVFDNFAGSSRQLLDLVPAEQGDANAHPATSYAKRTGIG